MHPSDIAAALKKEGWSASALGREVGVSQVSVSRVIAGKGRSERIEHRISEITDIPLYRLWPQWHEPPKGAPKEFDPTKLSYELLEAIERTLAAELQRLVPGLQMPFIVRARHRAAIYNACVKRGAMAIETAAGTADEVRRFLEAWDDDYERTTGEKPTAEALRKWALHDHREDTPAGKSGATATHGSVAIVGNDNQVSGSGSRRRKR